MESIVYVDTVYEIVVQFQRRQKENRSGYFSVFYIGDKPQDYLQQAVSYLSDKGIKVFSKHLAKVNSNLHIFTSQF